jgi:hypothetical protein
VCGAGSVDHAGCAWLDVYHALRSTPAIFSATASLILRPAPYAVEAIPVLFVAPIANWADAVIPRHPEVFRHPPPNRCMDETPLASGASISAVSKRRCNFLSGRNGTGSSEC